MSDTSLQRDVMQALADNQLVFPDEISAQVVGNVPCPAAFLCDQRVHRGCRWLPIACDQGRAHARYVSTCRIPTGPEIRLRTG